MASAASSNVRRQEKAWRPIQSANLTSRGVGVSRSLPSYLQPCRTGREGRRYVRDAGKLVSQAVLDIVRSRIWISRHGHLSVVIHSPPLDQQRCYRISVDRKGPWEFLRHCRFAQSSWGHRSEEVNVCWSCYCTPSVKPGKGLYLLD